jgi:hypothetical protein
MQHFFFFSMARKTQLIVHVSTIPTWWNHTVIVVLIMGWSKKQASCFVSFDDELGALVSITQEVARCSSCCR